MFAACCPELARSEAFIVDTVSKDAQEQLLKQISKKTPVNTISLIILDRAPWHKNIEYPENIILHFLPPYSPELNMIERVWLKYKENFLSNIIFESIEDIFSTLTETWNTFIQDTDFIKSFFNDRWPGYHKSLFII